MNAIADWLFSLLLGWTGRFFNTLWNGLRSTGSFLDGFFSKLWLPLLLILIVAGTAADYLIWFIRWQPLKARRLASLRRRNQQSLRDTQKAMEHGDISGEYRSEIAAIVRDAKAQPTTVAPVVSHENAPQPLAAPFDYEALYQPPMPAVQAEASWQQPGENEGFEAVLPPDEPPVYGISPEPPPQTEPLAMEEPPFRPCAVQDAPEEPPRRRRSAVYYEQAKEDLSPAVRAYLDQMTPDSEQKPARRRRADKQKRAQGGLINFVRNQLVSDEEERMLDELAPPRSMDQTFNAPVYPENYPYRKDNPS